MCVKEGAVEEGVVDVCEGGGAVEEEGVVDVCEGGGGSGGGRGSGCVWRSRR